MSTSEHGTAPPPTAREHANGKTVLREPRPRIRAAPGDPGRLPGLRRTAPAAFAEGSARPARTKEPDRARDHRRGRGLRRLHRLPRPGRPRSAGASRQGGGRGDRRHLLDEGRPRHDLRSPGVRRVLRVRRRAGRRRREGLRDDHCADPSPAAPARRSPGPAMASTSPRSAPSSRPSPGAPATPTRTAQGRPRASSAAERRAQRSGSVGR